MESLDSESLQKPHVTFSGRSRQGGKTKFKPGVSANPGGKSKLIVAMRHALAECSAEGVQFLRSVINGELVKGSIDGEAVECTPSVDQRLKAVELCMRYSLHMPKALTPEEMDAHDTGEISGDAKALLTKVAAEELVKYLKANGH